MRSRSIGIEPFVVRAAPAESPALRPPPLLDRLLHLHQQFAELLVHVADLLDQLGEIDLEFGHRPECLENRERRLRERDLREDMRHLAEQAGPAQAVFGGHAQQHAVETADMAVFDCRQSMILELAKNSLSVAATKTRDGLEGCICVARAANV